MSWTLCTSGAAVAKAGTNANSDIVVSGAILTGWSDEVEGTICMKTRKDWITSYASESTPIQGTISDLASDLIGIKIINYDMAGYLKGEAQTMLDVLTTNSDTIIKDLRLGENQSINK